VTGLEKGYLRASVAPGNGVTAASCERPTPPSCGVPCVQSWSLTTAP